MVATPHEHPTDYKSFFECHFIFLEQLIDPKVAVKFITGLPSSIVPISQTVPAPIELSVSAKAHPRITAPCIVLLYSPLP